MKNIKISIFKTSIVILLSIYVLIQFQSRNNGRYELQKGLNVFDNQTGIIYDPQRGVIIDLIEESITRNLEKVNEEN